MRIAIRTDSSTLLGSGHLVRCLTLAKVCRKLGADITFFCADLGGNLTSLVAAEQFPLRMLPAQGEGAGPSFATADSLAFLAAAEVDEAYDWLVVDHYQLGAEWERSARRRARKVLVIDDLADRAHHADVLLDQNLVAGYQTRYEGLVDQACLMLLGPRFALIQKAFRDWKAAALGEKAGTRVLVYFGASDQYRLTEKTVTALLAMELDFAVDIVIGPRTPDAAAIRQAVAQDARFTVHDLLPSLAPLLASASLAVGGSGATNWERICFAVPTVTIVLAENQRAIDEELMRRGAVLSLGDAGSLTVDAIGAALRGVFERRLAFPGLAALARTIDAWGSLRVAHSLLVAAQPFVLRPAEESDVMPLFNWANDPDVRRFALDPLPIPLAGHQRWFAAKLADPDNCRIYIAGRADGTTMGYVRFERRDGAWTVSYALDGACRGQGLGRPLLAMGIARLFETVGDVELRAQVRQYNAASLRIFRQMAFQQVPGSDDPVTFTGRSSGVRILGDVHV